MHVVLLHMVENDTRSLFSYLFPSLHTALQIKWSVCDSLTLVEATASRALDCKCSLRGPGPSLIYLINLKSDRLAEAARCCLFLSLPTERHKAPWKQAGGKLIHVSRTDQPRQVCVLVMAHRGINCRN